MSRAILIPKQNLRGVGSKQWANHDRGGRRPAQGPKTLAGREICISFNAKMGCKWGRNCKFAHVCTEPGCEKEHPQYQHASQ